MHKKLEDITKIKERLIECTKAKLDEGIEKVDTEELGEVTDMIKDLAEAEEKCWKACYYKEMVMGMKEGEDGERAGYDNWRYSSGRFAPTGRGHYSPGYTPMHMMDDDYDPMGYTKSQSGSRTSYSADGRGTGSSSMGRSGYTHPMMDKGWGDSYTNYDMARRHYTESHSDSDKKMMDDHAKKHIEETVDTIKDIWKDADPNLQHIMKEKFGKLINDMK